MDNEYCLDVNIGLDWILADQNYFSTVDLDPLIVNHFKLHNEHFTAEFISWLESAGLELWFAELFYCPPNAGIFKHVDCVTPSDSCKLNWVYDQDQTLMRWFTLKDGASLISDTTGIGSTYLRAEHESDYVLAHAHRIGKPSLVNVSVPHDVVNSSDAPRWCVSVAVKERGADTRIGFNRLKELLVGPATVAR